MLHIKDLQCSIGEKEILRGINLDVNPGEIHAIMGRNGSGKSTLAHLIAGKETAQITNGSIIYKGMDLNGKSPEERALEGIFLSFPSRKESEGKVSGKERILRKDLSRPMTHSPFLSFKERNRRNDLE